MVCYLCVNLKKMGGNLILIYMCWYEQYYIYKTGGNCVVANNTNACIYWLQFRTFLLKYGSISNTSWNSIFLPTVYQGLLLI